jgi:hypothetical protein
MKRLPFPLGILLFFFVFLTSVACTKTVTETKTVTVTDTITKTITDTITRIDTVQLYPIQGLWVGTYTAAVNGGNPYFFSFTVFADGSLNYKSKGAGNTTFYAYGSWALAGTSFTFSVTEVSSGHVQQGSASYNSNNGTLSSGIITDSTAGTNATWTLNRVN